MALFLKPDPNGRSGSPTRSRMRDRKSQANSTGKGIGKGIGRHGRKGFVWVRQSESDPGLTMLGVSDAPPTDTDLAADLATWRIQYFALVDDTMAAMSDASRFLSSFADLSSALDNVYRTQPVIAATAIETSGAAIRFRKSSFARSASSASAEPITESDDLDDVNLRSILEKSVARRQRVNDLVGELQQYEDVLARSESITGFKIPVIDSPATPVTAESDNETVTGDAAGSKSEPREMRRKPRHRQARGRTAPPGRGRRGIPASLRDEQNRPILYKDVEPRQEVQLEGPDLEAMRRMERLILRREATQNLRRIRRGYLMSFLQGMPIGALIGFGIVVGLNLPADNEMLIRFVLAGACAAPLTLFAIRLIRNHSRSSHWRRVLRT